MGPALNYNIEHLPIQPKPSQGPYYLSSNGSIYDKDYSQILPSTAGSADVSDNFEERRKQLASLGIDANLFTGLPQAEDYDNFFDYEKALLDWKVAIENALQNLKLPKLSGRHFYRPRVSAERLRGASGSNELLEAPSSESVVQIQQGVSSVHSTSSQEDQRTQEEDEELLQRVNIMDPSGKTQFLRLLKTRRANSAMVENELCNVRFEKEPWDAMLIPQEPDPQQFSTYEEYETAMKRWAALCSHSSNIPPHASQLKELIPIQTVEKTTDESRKDEGNEKDHESSQQSAHKARQMAMIHVPFMPDSPSPSVGQPQQATPSSEGQPQVSISPEVAEHIKMLLCQMIKPENTSGKSKSTRQLLPIIHGTFPRPAERGGSTTFMKLKQTKNKALRRTDLTGPMISACMDCPAEIDGKRVEFKIADFDIDWPDLITKLREQKTKEQCRQGIRQVQHSDVHDSLNSWYSPQTPKEIHMKHRQFIDEALGVKQYIGKDVKLDLSVLERVVSGGMFLDKFQELMGEILKEDLGRSYLHQVLGIIVPENLPEFLRLFERHKSPLTLGKLSYLVSEMLQSNRAKVLFESLVTAEDAKSLSLLAYAMMFFNDVPLDIMPYDIEQIYLLKNKYGNNTEKVTNMILCGYYVSVLSSVINKQPFAFVSINQCVTETRKSLSNGLASLLQSSAPDFLQTTLWSALGSRCHTMSYFALFLLHQLMNNHDSSLLQSLLRSPSTDLLGRVRQLSRAKFAHLQFAATRIFNTMQKDQWIDFLYSKYTEDSLFEDLTGANLHRKRGDPFTPSILAKLTLDMCLTALNRVNEATVVSLGFLLDEGFFHRILRHLSTIIKVLDDRASVLTTLMVALSKTYFRLKAVSGNNNVKGTVKKKGTFTLTITPIEIQKIVSIVVEATRSDGVIEKTFVDKANMLGCLRHLVKADTVYELVKKEADFFNKLTIFCRDGNDTEFNRNAWQMFYQMIHYHSGTLDFLIKSNLLSPFLELVGTSSNNIVITNGLHYITKLFSMIQMESKKIAKGKPSRTEKDSLRGFEKDVKTLNAFFKDRNLFILVHMIYRKLIQYYSGAPFLELAQFYHVLNTSPHCAKLLKDVSKKTEYNLGLMRIQSMYGNDNSEENMNSPKSPSVLPKKGPMYKTGSMFSLLSSRDKDKDRDSITPGGYMRGSK